MPKKPTYGELQRRVAELEVQQQQQTIALRESEERFRVMQELSPDGFTILRPLRDAQGNIIDFTWIYENPAIARISGTDAKTVAGRCLLELFPGHGGSPFLEAYIQVAQTGESRVLEAQYSGESIRNPTWFRTVIVRMGQDIAILAQDITERKRLEAELHESRAKLETAFASMRRTPGSIRALRALS
jgi:PAS domain S-box-containing protein